MSISAERKQAVIAEYATAPGDTGSPEVQVAILTSRINSPLSVLAGEMFMQCERLAGFGIRPMERKWQ